MENDLVPALVDIDFRLPEISIAQLISWGASCCMMFGGIVPFVPQYLVIKRTDNADGFSTHVCLVLLIASTLRILFWFGHPFELPLLAQSIIMFVTMMALLRVCTNVRALNEISTAKRVFTDQPSSPSSHKVRFEDGQPVDHVVRAPSEVTLPNTFRGHYFTDFDKKYFWKWSRFIDYCQFMVLFCAICSSMTYLLINNVFFIETLGFLAVFIEALLGAPQFYRNYQNLSTQGMSIQMVCFWLSGDTFKTGYFIINKAPLQFSLCGALQVFIDLAILGQVFYYRKHTRFKTVIAKASMSDEHIS
ncbi:PQ-loop repeat-containing protein 1 [Holothuria leucospilota]|uniref:Solute carrier family 66 member 2 n=1 Tax=Holothuria leucospilota TaxID=206669 RepID=A0A9Q1HDT8_HOLLE|nr:PQ-loop repeat-containing protein 1 [Holothuria leucospilota]